MFRCTEGHRSTEPEYCHLCGSPVTVQVRAGSATEADLCHRCGTGFHTHDRYCVQCGADRDPTVWWARVVVDPAHFARTNGLARGFFLPEPIPPPRAIRLAGATVRIGRPSRTAGTQPEIDLSAPPADPCVSREHAVLTARRDGAWTVMDIRSTNGTYVDDDPRRLAPLQEVPLPDGGRVHVGVWTTVSVHREAGASR